MREKEEEDKGAKKRQEAEEEKCYPVQGTSDIYIYVTVWSTRDHIVS